MRTRASVTLASLLVVVSAGAAFAFFTDSAPVGGNSFATATLQPPTGLAATASCQGLFTAKIVLSWTSASLADGYDVYRSTTNGGPYSNIAHVTGGSTTTYTNTNLNTGTTYYYVLRSTRNSWTSVNSSQAQATTPVLCL
ncbi:MAG: hypothetical protein ACRDKS_13105 [Actinomycetota bacterium]